MKTLKYIQLYAWVFLLGVLIVDTPSALALSEKDYRPVSLVSLIATPEKFDGTLVLVQGVAYLDRTNGIYALYLTRDDKRAGNGQNGLFLILAGSFTAPGELNERYVMIRGKFEAKNKGRLDSFSGSLSGVDLIRAVELDVK